MSPNWIGAQIDLFGAMLTVPEQREPAPATRRPTQQPLRLPGRGTDPQLAERLLRRADRHRGVRSLVRSTPIITAVISTLQVLIPGMQEPRRACLITVLALVPLPGHAMARPGRLAPRHKARPRLKMRSAGG